MEERLKKVILNKELNVKGFCNSPIRERTLEEAVKALNDNPAEWAKKRYYGIKDYAHFGDQREDHEYGRGPRHGSIVFSIGRGSNYSEENVSDYIDLLLFFRDFRNSALKSNRGFPLSLDGAVTEQKYLEDRLSVVNNVLSGR